MADLYEQILDVSLSALFLSSATVFVKSWCFHKRLSVHKGDTHLGTHPPGRHTPLWADISPLWVDTPLGRHILADTPLGRHPQTDTPPGQTPPIQTLPPGRHPPPLADTSLDRIPTHPPPPREGFLLECILVGLFLCRNCSPNNRLAFPFGAGTPKKSWIHSWYR